LSNILAQVFLAAESSLRQWHGRCDCLGMTKKTSLTRDDALNAAVHQFTQQVLADGCNPADLSCALTAVAVRIGLDLAPSASIAFAVVMRAASDAAADWASSQNSQDADLDSVTTLCGTTVH
jgi:hypothetical protein